MPEWEGEAFQERVLHEQRPEEGRHTMSLNLSEISGRTGRQGSHHMETFRLGKESGFILQEMESHCWTLSQQVTWVEGALWLLWESPGGGGRGKGGEGKPVRSPLPWPGGR